MELIASEDIRKLRGGYYTPSVLCNFLSKWAIRRHTDTVLEPSCGDGEIVRASTQALIDLGCKAEDLNRQVVAVEFNELEAKKASTSVNKKFNIKNFKVLNSDFFQYAEKAKEKNTQFDVAIGNPPFIRYQNFKEEHREIAFNLMQELGLRPNRLTNSWVPFVITASSFLKVGGRMAMVIPSELYQVSYSAETRKFLLENFSKITLINFKELIFHDAQQEVILFLGEKTLGPSEGINFLEFENVEDLVNSDFLKNETIGEFRPVLKNTEKWTKYYLTSIEIELLRKLSAHKQVARTIDFFDVDVGVVSGQNKFFVIDKDTTAKYSLDDYTIKCITRTNFLQGLDFRTMDWKNEYMANKPSNLLKVTNDHVTEGLSKKLKAYIKTGEDDNFHSGYKCRIRKNWYAVPSVWTPSAFFLRQVYRYPKIVLNSAQACPTDTIHRLSFRSSRVSPKILTLAFLNSMTFAHSEVMGRSYGGGVLTFEPSEAEDLLFPKIPDNFECDLDFNLIDKLLRAGQIEEVLDLTDEVFLKNLLGFSQKNINNLRKMWRKLSDRRIGRKHSAKEDEIIIQ